MIKYITKEVKVEEREIASIQCDRCKVDYDDDYEMQEFHHIYITGGYSSVFGDGCRVECNICQHCLKKYIEKHCRITEGMLE